MIETLVIETPRQRLLRRRNRIITVLVTADMVILNAGSWSPIGATVLQEWDDFRTSRPDYMSTFGHWSILDVPAKFRANGIHAALLPTGKILIIAGSGNNIKNFEAGSFTTLL